MAPAPPERWEEIKMGGGFGRISNTERDNDMGSMGAAAHVDATQAGVHASWRGSTCLGRWYTAGALNGGEDVWLQIPEIPHRAIGPEEGEADPKTRPPKMFSHQWAWNGKHLPAHQTPHVDAHRL